MCDSSFGSSSSDIDSIIPHFFLDDADPAEMADYANRIIIAILNNVERQHEYLRSPSVQLQQQITAQSTSIAIAVQCTNASIQQIVCKFKLALPYGDSFVQDHTLQPTPTMNAQDSSKDNSLKSTPATLLMLSDNCHSDSDDQSSLDIEIYRSTTTALGDDFQRSCAIEIDQMDDDINYEENAQTDRIILDCECQSSVMTSTL